ncbi:ChaN family lipoprotein [Microbaculum marinum]|uniref:ChaN family lipoprotein n=1 Tax=Microbaculum marinum TaxID=1764581 RepID=A0AAW9RQU5_9HYPH
MSGRGQKAGPFHLRAHGFDRRTARSAAFALAALAACLLQPPSSASAATLDARAWISEHFRTHPLAGTVWRGDGTRSDLDTLLTAARAADHVLVGETHPNPDHHRIQADIIRDLTDSGRKPAVVLEMVPASYQDRLDAFSRAKSADASDLGAMLDWEDRGWPAWTIYQPIAESALASGLSLRAGDLDREQMMQIGSSGAAALSADRVRALGLDLPLDDDLEAGLLEVLKAAHCNLLPEAALAPMVTVQRARDGALAAAMLEAGTADGAVLVAGAGHARNDWAVPHVLRQLAPEATVMSVGLIEVTDSLPDFSDYAEGGTAMPYDFVIFTPKSEIKDHCAELGERFANPARSD